MFTTDAIYGSIPVDAVKSPQPKNLSVQLKDHQLKLVHYMEHFESGEKIPITNQSYIYTHFGFICDKVGSGKSFVILGVISNNILIKNQSDRDKCIFFNKGVEVYSKLVRNTANCLPLNIIVVPHGIVCQWIDYIKKATPTLRFFTIKTSKDYEQFVGLDLSEIDLLLVSSTKFNGVAKHFEGFTISRLIFDEVDSINIPNCLHINAKFTWLISSSVNTIFKCDTRNIGFLRSLTLILNSNSEFLQYLILKNPDDVVEQSLALSEPIVNKIICKENINLRVLSGIIDHSVCVMVNAGAVKEAINSLQIEQTDEVSLVSVVCKGLLTELHNKEIEYKMKQKMVFSSTRAKEQALELVTNKISEIKNKISQVQERIRETDMDPITYEDIENPVITKCCQNKFDFKSLTQALQKNKSCPMCRSIITPSMLVYVNDELDSKVSDEKVSDYNYANYDKFENLRYLLMNKIKDRKMLIFSEFDESFYKIYQILGELDIKYKFIQGSSAVIKHTVNEYKQGSLEALLLNARNFGAGLNLENTKDIIILHKMNSDLDKQVIGRAQRLGRSEPLRVWRILYQNEV